MNKYDDEKYKKLDRALITKSDKKTIAKQYLWNKLQGKPASLHSVESKVRNVPENKVVKSMNGESRSVSKNNK